MDYITIGTNAFFAGIAGTGFAFLFNVPRRVLIPIIVVASIGGFMKYFFLEQSYGLVWSSLIAGITVGTLSVPFAKWWYSPPLIIAIPGIVPMVPGSFMYKMILGMISIGTTKGVIKPDIINETIHNGIFSLFIIIAISVGAGLPAIVSRRQIMTSIKKEDHPLPFTHHIHIHK